MTTKKEDRYEPLLQNPRPTNVEPIPLPYEWPNLYDETNDMLLSAILMYGMVDLRTLARSNKFKEDLLMRKLLSLPVSAKDVVILLTQHYDGIMEEEFGRQSTELYLNVFDSIQSISLPSQESEQEVELTASGNFSLVSASFDIVVVEDDLQNEELVFAICLDTARRRITVLFRGCSTNMDWKIAASNFLKEMDNPLHTQTHHQHQQQQQQQPEKISIHQGYCSYLFRTNPTTGASKFDTIIYHVQSLLQQNPGYQVYVTGHSLGAALATVFAFQAAATQQFGLITCINFASPKVGNLAFETAFRTLEIQGRIRCLRVTNYFDIFTQLPDRGNWMYVFVCCWGFHLIAYIGWTLMFFLCFQNNVYRHVGMDLHMYRSRRRFFSSKDDESFTYVIKHSRGTSTNFIWRVARDWKTHMKQTIQRLLAIPYALNFRTNHGPQEHLTRLNQLSTQLEGVYLKELYESHRPIDSDVELSSF